MTRAAMILGLTGGIFGAMCAVAYTPFAAVYLGGWGIAFGVIGVLLGVAGMFGGARAEKHRRSAGLLMLIPGLLGFACVSVFWAIPGFMLVTAGALEVAGRPKPLAQNS